ncbi:MAG: 5'-nucleotidase, lipoprotein e(P4) family [Cytophagales bacterium]|nr:5'-nucleotidase, lipoprotein e(P4) family [Cytophagales bacterium]
MKNVLYISLTVLLIGCQSPPTGQQDEADYSRQITEQSVLANLWFQQSAEMTASYLQSYNYAKILLDAKLDTARKEGKYGVVLDIDETVLDNSPEAVSRIKKGDTFNKKDWKKWSDESRAKELPGVKDFVDYAIERNIEVFYISNRMVDELDATMKNLRELGFPNADEQHIFLKSTTSDKTDRRAIVSDQVEVLLYVGDNLRDYQDIFGKRGDDMGKNLVYEKRQELLNNFVILPNPIYGEWEKPIYGNDMGMTDSLKLVKRIEVLED